jgi:hypothetical protein
MKQFIPHYLHCYPPFTPPYPPRLRLGDKVVKDHETSQEADTDIHKNDINGVVRGFYPLIHGAYYYYGNILIK